MTHQQIANVSDQELVERMLASHDERFNHTFWDYFDEHVRPALPDAPTIVDIGCGPGLLLRDIRARLPGADLTGTDVTRAMIDHAEQKVAFAGAKPRFVHHDVTTEPLPFADGSVDLVTMVAVLHVLNDPYAVVREILRVLKPSGRLMLQDWVRTPMPAYFDRMLNDVEPGKEKAARARFMPLFTVHNKYTLDDWLWLLRDGGLTVSHHQQLTGPHFCTFVCRRS